MREKEKIIKRLKTAIGIMGHNETKHLQYENIKKRRKEERERKYI